MHTIQVRPERFPVDLFVQSNQWITHFGELVRAFRYVKKSWLPFMFHLLRAYFSGYRYLTFYTLVRVLEIGKFTAFLEVP